MATENVTKLPPVSILRSLISKSKTNASKTAELNGDTGQAISNAVDKHGLHAAAFKLVRKLERMGAVKLMAFLTHMDDYRAKLQLDKLAAADIPGLGEDGEDAETEADKDKPKKHIFDDKAAVN